MTFLDETYFVGEILIPNLSASADPSSSANQASIRAFIAQWEPDFLVKLLGATLYQDFVAGMATVPIPAKWAALKAAIATSESVGTGATAVTYYRSPAANYVYFMFTRHMASQTGPTGELTQKFSSGENSVSVIKLVNAWNHMVADVNVIRDFLTDHQDDYPDWDASQYQTVVLQDYFAGTFLSADTDPFRTINEMGTY